MGDRRGTSLVEFALVLPCLLTLFLGGYQVCDAIACQRRVTVVARATADMTSQYRTVTNNDLNTILNASTQIMQPYSVAAAGVRLTSMTIRADGKLVVNWSKGLNTGGYVAATYAAGVFVASGFPAELNIPGTSYVLSQVTYNYDPKLGSLVKPISFSQRIFMVPRKSDAVLLTTG
jgi:Flp pilus assembly protein TadG